MLPYFARYASSLQKSGRTRDVLGTYFEEIVSNGYEVNLKKMRSSLPQLFGELGSRAKEIEHDTYQRTTIFFIMKEAFQLALDGNISADPEVRRIVGEICTEIDRILGV